MLGSIASGEDAAICLDHGETTCTPSDLLLWGLLWGGILKMKFYPMKSNDIGGAVRLMRTSLGLPYPALGSGCKETAPLGESGGAVALVDVSAVKAAFLVEVV